MTLDDLHITDLGRRLGLDGAGAGVKMAGTMAEVLEALR